MILIADGGSTKTSWCQLASPGSPDRVYFNTEGYNPYFIDTAGIVASLEASLPAELPRAAVTSVSYYGAGCSTPANVATVARALQEVFAGAAVAVGHDLLAAARALLGRGAGFAAILGTGTNSCLYDGQGVARNIDSLGYFLGDEGSGSWLGKRLLRDYMRGLLPEGLQEAFRQQYGLLNEQIFDALYHQPLPNRFLASFSPFAYAHNNTGYCRAIVVEGFEAFFQNLVTRYPRYQDYSFNCVGSVGYNFRDALAQVARAHGMQVGKIIRSPIDDLVDYHVSVLQAQ
ncbi:N-acetylglucosamine kinase [Hymenobacter busanensis]|uniref:N-acetylglucosamine kinase n=1 Tax=Hymenobacter busanensis TaxID=2607656 RepID=A0A7L4ZZF8_9BACT|nr:N-acetylglucosamine kinase [Hymenobacter busanensis]KAA9339379.1 N-acetylglucosamine kinase [Hymenobacter busanensis]QHJ06860.1 N-acetylglucosamine kinase [Hymenobacter busanensis]